MSLHKQCTPQQNCHPERSEGSTYIKHASSRLLLSRLKRNEMERSFLIKDLSTAVEVTLLFFSNYVMLAKRSAWKNLFQKNCHPEQSEGSHLLEYLTHKILPPSQGRGQSDSALLFIIPDAFEKSGKGILSQENTKFCNFP